MNTQHASKWIAGSFAFLLMLSMTPSAHASFKLRIYEDGVLKQTVVDNNKHSGDTSKAKGQIVFSGTVGDFSINTSLSATPILGHGGSLEFGSTSITNTSGSQHTIKLFASANHYFDFAGTSPMRVFSSILGSDNTGSLSGDFTSYASADNKLFGTSFSTQKLSYTTTQGQNFGGNNNKPSFLSPKGHDFSISNKGNFTLDGNGKVTISSASTQVVAPAPATLVLALSGVPCLAMGFWMFRRQKIA